MTTPLPQINALVTNDLVDKVTDAIGFRRHEYQVDHDTWRPYCICGWSAEESYDVAAYDRHLAVEALEAVAPLIAAAAWDEGFAMSELAWRHIYDGHDCAEGEMCPTCCQPNPYRADRCKGNPYERKDEQ